MFTFTEEARDEQSSWERVGESERERERERVNWKKAAAKQQTSKNDQFYNCVSVKSYSRRKKKKKKKKHGNNNTIFLQKNSMMPTLTEWNDQLNGVERLAYSELIYSVCKLKILYEVLGGLAGRIEFFIEFFRDTKQNDRFSSRLTNFECELFDFTPISFAMNVCINTAFSSVSYTKNSWLSTAEWWRPCHAALPYGR